MAATWTPTILKQTVFGDQRVVYVSLAGSGTYTTGGDVVTDSSLGLDYIDFMDAGPAISSTSAYIVNNNQAVPNATGIKIQLYGMNAAAGVGNALTEITAGTSVAGFTIVLEVRGV